MQTRRELCILHKRFGDGAKLTLLQSPFMNNAGYDVRIIHEDRDDSAAPHPHTCSRRFLSIHGDGFYSVSEYYGAVLIDAYNVRSLPLRIGLSGPMTSNYTSFCEF